MSQQTALDINWAEMAQTLSINTQAFINGKYTHSLSHNSFSSVNPATGEKIVDISRCQPEDLELAVACARKSFEQGVWANKSNLERKQVLFKVAELIDRDRAEFALLETLDMGKNIRDSFNIDVTRAIEAFQWYGEALDKVYGEISPSTQGKLGTITSEPLGVVAAIVPWNFPLVMAAWKLGPALAVGNSVILKPSERSSLTAIKLAGIMKEAGIPDGVFNVLPGLGHDLGEAIGLHMDIDCVVFTGSTATGKRLMQYSGQSNMKKIFTECGGKSPNIIFDDCGDLDTVCTGSAHAIFFNQGEVCVAGSRLLVDNSIKDDVVKKLALIAQEMQPGDSLDPSFYMGPLVDNAHLKQVIAFVDGAKAQGAKLVCGGEAVLQESGGYFIPPTIFTNVTPDMTIFNEEIFGPVLTITGFDTEEEALKLANHGCYGLAAGFWTENLSRAHRVAKKLRAGSVWVNGWSAGDITMPFGGYKQSGNGRDKSLHALEKFTEQKATVFGFVE